MFGLYVLYCIVVSLITRKEWQRGGVLFRDFFRRGNFLYLGPISRKLVLLKRFFLGLRKCKKCDFGIFQFFCMRLLFCRVVIGSY